MQLHTTMLNFYTGEVGSEGNISVTKNTKITCKIY